MQKNKKYCVGYLKRIQLRYKYLLQQSLIWMMISETYWISLGEGTLMEIIKKKKKKKNYISRTIKASVIIF